MADNTKLKELHEGLRKNDLMIKEMKEGNEQELTRLEQSLEKITMAFEVFVKMQQDKGKEKTT